MLARKFFRRDVKAEIRSLLVKEFSGNDWIEAERETAFGDVLRVLGGMVAERLDGDRGLSLGGAIICTIMNRFKEINVNERSVTRKKQESTTKH